MDEPRLGGGGDKPWSKNGDKCWMGGLTKFLDGGTPQEKTPVFLSWEYIFLQTGVRLSKNMMSSPLTLFSKRDIVYRQESLDSNIILAHILYKHHSECTSSPLATRVEEKWPCNFHTNLAMCAHKHVLFIVIFREFATSKQSELQRLWLKINKTEENLIWIRITYCNSCHLKMNHSYLKRSFSYFHQHTTAKYFVKTVLLMCSFSIHRYVYVAYFWFCQLFFTWNWHKLQRIFFNLNSTNTFSKFIS